MLAVLSRSLWLRPGLAVNSLCLLLWLKMIHYSNISPTNTNLICSAISCYVHPAPLLQVDSFSNSGKRGFCCSQLRAVFLFAMMCRLLPTSSCSCRPAVRRSWKEGRSSTSLNSHPAGAGIAASLWSSPRTSTCCCWLRHLQTAGLDVTGISLITLLCRSILCPDIGVMFCDVIWPNYHQLPWGIYSSSNMFWE